MREQNFFKLLFQSLWTNEKRNIPLRRKQRNEKKMGEMREKTTAKDLIEIHGIPADTFRMRWNTLSRKAPHLFFASFDRNAMLSPEQVELLLGAGKSQKPTNKETDEGAAEAHPPVTMSHAQGRPNEVAPQLVGVNWWKIIPLLIAFALPTVASLGNTYRVSHHLSNDATTSLAIMLVMSCVPLLFIWAGAGGLVSVFAAVWLVLFEAFCNLSATYLALMGGMTYVFDQPRGECSPFLETVCRLTDSGYQRTAFALGCAVAFSLLAAQLTAFYELKKRI